MTGIANATTEPKEHDEIEVTEEMRRAGAAVIASYAPESGTLLDCAEDTFVAMVRAKGRADPDADIAPSSR